MVDNELKSELNDICDRLYSVNFNSGIQEYNALIPQLSFLVDNSETNDILNLLLHVLENKDYVLLADIIKYELLPKIY